jgi:uncharacterized protein (TIGR03437 family)
MDSLPFVRIRFLLLLAASTAWAQQPFLPTVTAMPGSPSRVMFATYKGALARSADLGATWTPVYITDPGSPQPPVVGIAIDILDNKTLYLSTTIAAGGVWRSTDSGATWTAANSGLPATGGSVLDLKQIAGAGLALFAHVGNQLYRSQDHGSTWLAQGALPSGNGVLTVADSPFNLMYFVDAITLSVFQSLDFGHSWILNGALPVPLVPGQVTLAANVLSSSATTLYVSVTTPGIGSAAYLSTSSGGSFTDQTGAGLGLFTKVDSASGPPLYAFSSPGFYRSDDNGQSWKGFGINGGVPYALGAVDPFLRTTVYAIRGGSTPAFVRSIDSGNNWATIPATITPTLAKPVQAINAVVEETAPYSQSFTVRAFEDASWALPVTITTTGEPWLQLTATSGITPLPNSVIISTTGMPPGTYQSTITISAPQSFNQSVTIPVQLTIRPAGSLGPQYSVATAGGSGDLSTVVTSGAATTVGLGAVKALAFDNSGRLLISGGNRIWQLSNNLITPIAGNGTFASTGDGTDAVQASIADPDSILVDAQNTIYFTEFSTGRIRKILNNAVSQVVDLTRFNVQPSHAVLIDSFGRFILANSTGLLRYDGSKVQTVTAYPLNDPYSMVADSAGNIYISDRGAHQIFKFAATGAVSVFAGLGSQGFGGDGALAVNALLNTPSGLAMDAQGTIYVADAGNQRIRAITSDGVIHTIAGSGVRGFSGDGSTADFAAFTNPGAVAVDATGNVYIADTGNNRIRKLALASVPTPKPTAVVHAASGSLQIAPGGLFSVYGDLLSLVTAQSNTATWPKSLGSVSVSINGIFAPLYYVSKGLINGQVPYEVAPGPATVIVTVSGSLPAQVSAQVVAANPGLLLYQGRALAVNPDASVNGPTAPANPNSFAILYLSGIGISSPPVATGAPAPSAEPFARVNYPYSITVGGQAVNVPFFGLAPGYPALAQANIIIPNFPAGDYPVVVTVNGVPSNSATISIGPKN